MMILLVIHFLKRYEEKCQSTRFIARPMKSSLHFDFQYICAFLTTYLKRVNAFLTCMQAINDLNKSDLEY